MPKCIILRGGKKFPPLKIVSSVAAYVIVHCCIVFHCVMELQTLPNSLGPMPIVPRSRTVQSQGLSLLRRVIFYHAN